MTTLSRRWLPGTAALSLLLAWACSTGSGSQSSRRGQPSPDNLADGIRALETGDYEEASRRFRWLAARCESGADGRRAVLLLATAALDPRNPEGSPDEGARLTAHALRLPGVDPGQRVVAETLFLLALEGGAQVPARSGRTSSANDEDVGLAPRFQDCDVADPAGIAPARFLPVLPGAPTAVLHSRVRAERDSLRSRVEAVEAELQRIRALLHRSLPSPPDSGDHQ